MSTKRHELTSAERHEHIDSKMDGIWSQIHHLSRTSAHEPQPGFPRFPGYAAAIPPSAPAPVTEIRDHYNEHKFQHLENVISNVTSPMVTAERPDPFQGLQALAPRSRLGRKAGGCACHCRCHKYSLNSDHDLKLSTFRVAFGSFSFGYSTFRPRVTCDVKTCRRSRSKWVRITYTIPDWLFHATVTTVLSNNTGPVELILRVYRRIAPDSIHVFNGIYGQVRQGNIEQVKLMLQSKEGSVTDVLGDIGRGLLHVAVSHQKFEMAKLLVQEGADWFQEQDNGTTPCHAAFKHLFANPEISESRRRLLQSLMPFDLAIERAELSDLHMVVMGILNLDLSEFLRLRSCVVNVCDSQGKTPLYYAVAMGHVATVMTLLEAGADPDFDPPNALLAKPLHVACQYGYLEIVRLLVAAGANVDAPDEYERTPMMLLSGRTGAVSDEKGRYNSQVDIRIVNYLVDHGADVLAQDFQRDGVLDHLCTRNAHILVEYLLTHYKEIDINHRDWEGTTPLGNAVAFYSYKTIEVLLRHGADYQTVDKNGQNLFHYVALAGDIEMLRFFIRLVETGVMSGLGATMVNHVDLTPSQLFNRRADVSLEMKHLWLHFLDIISRPREESDGVFETSEQEEFYDALEYL